MCKVMAMAGLKEENRKAAWQFIKAARTFMTANDPHGLGYAASCENGIFGERWVNPNTAFKHREQAPHDLRIIAQLGDAVASEQHYNSFGDITYQYHADAIIYHSRYATCSKGLKNTHPFVSNNTALIHNGVISNSRELKNITSTCDSECILNEYVDKFVNYDPTRIEAVADNLSGYYACCVLTEDAEGTRVLDIFKDSGASLYCAYIKKLDAVVYCTSGEIITKTLKRLQWGGVTAIHTVNEGYLIRINCETGDVMSKHEFDCDVSYSDKSDTLYPYESGYSRYSGTKKSIWDQYRELEKSDNKDPDLTELSEIEDDNERRYG